MATKKAKAETIEVAPQQDSSSKSSYDKTTTS